MGFNEASLGLQAPLASVLCTQELKVRSPRPADPEALTAAFLRLAQVLETSPEQILQELVRTALDLCSAQSAGISLLEEENGRMIFRWHGVAGQFASHLWGTTPREFSPCGTVLDTDAVQLMSHPDRHFQYFAQVEPHIAEALLIPFHVNGEAVGTIWIISHDQNRRFDAEDARVISALGEFASATYQALSRTLVLKSVFATIRDPLIVLDANLRVETASRSFYQIFQAAPGDTEGHFLHQLGSREWNIPALLARLKRVLSEDVPVDNFAVTKEFSSLGRRTMLLNARKLWSEDHLKGLILLTIEDITNRKVSPQELLPNPVDAQLEHARVENLNPELVEGKVNFEEIIGNSQSMDQVLTQVELVAPTDATVLILGETGTGKELVARAIHKMSPRKDGPFITLNCAAIPTGLLESELFGYEKGAFTGALSQKLGRFELATGGTLFLDEIGDIPLDLQPKLLRALQEKSFERLGGTRTISIDVRLVGATNRDLNKMMGDKVFRSDLYYRLMVFPIVTPPLRNHPEDIPILVRHFTKKYAAKMNRTIDWIPGAMMKAMSSWSWPGNVRELENFIERSVILSKGSGLRAPISELRTDASRAAEDFSLQEVERNQILLVFRQTGGVVSATANRLGIPRTTLNARMKKLGISRRDLLT